MSGHNDEEKQNVTVHDNKAVSNSARIKRIVEIIMLLLFAYATVENFSGRNNIVVSLILCITVVYHIVDDIRNLKKRKKQVVFEKNDEKAL
jgi:uncharacterized membrane protein YbaN (DUF454 family)